MVSPFSPEQIDEFVSFIDLPHKYRPQNEPPRDVAMLTALHVSMISTIPYENLTLHYSEDRNISLEPQDLYRKFITDKLGRGGYCMEDSLFYLHILRGLGFDVYPTGVRIRRRLNGIPQGSFTGWAHIVNLVTLEDGTQWMVDVGFGGDGATKPLPMLSGSVVQNLGRQEVRLIYDHIPEQYDRRPEKKLWIYQYRNGPEKEWNSYYCFSEMEFLAMDFDVMNWWTGNRLASTQMRQVVAVKFLRRKNADVSGDEEIYGKRMLINEAVKENLGDRTKLVQECKTEAERIQALKDYFGIILTSHQQTSIRGWQTELTPIPPE